ALIIYFVVYSTLKYVSLISDRSWEKTFWFTVNSGNPIYISAISVVEIAYLVEKGRFAEEVLTRIFNALDDPNVGIVLAPLDRNISGATRQIDRATVPDMPDRIIAATAFCLGLPLVTRDLQIQALTTIHTIW
ncbi:MAG: PIN domain-containing protein, partial [Nostoc sp.]|uniref:type II toxin-antitoxin system VapC family toxin n=1 Tax=Nostoc sp. TaxID=1180 RepID=UPI002FF5D63E